MSEDVYTEDELKEVFLEALAIYVYSMSDEALRETLEEAIFRRNRDLEHFNSEEDLLM